MEAKDTVIIEIQHCIGDLFIYCTFFLLMSTEPSRLYWAIFITFTVPFIGKAIGTMDSEENFVQTSSRLVEFVRKCDYILQYR